MNPQLLSMLQQAFEYAQRGNFSQAKPLVNYVLKMQPKNFDALYLMGFICGVENNHQEASSYSLRALKVRPDDLAANINSAKALQEIGRDLESIKYHQKAIALSPNDYKIWLGCGKSFQSLGRYDEAIAHYDKALELKPDFAEGWSNKGNTLHELKRYDEAITHYDKALELKPDYAEGWSNKGNTLHELERYDEAITHYDKALELKPDYAEGWSNKGNTLHKLKRHDEAIAHHDTALELKPNFAEGWSSKGLILHELKRYDEAITHFNELLSLRPQYHGAWFNKGNTLHELKRYDEAITHYDKALSLRPDYSEAWNSKGLTLHELKRYDEAITHYDKALSLRPDYPEGWLNKGLTFQELKQYDKAITHYDKALSLRPDYPEVWLNKAALNLFLKKYQAGWENYDWRLKTKDSQFKMAIEGLALWSGSSCKHLLIFSEQGVGDIIFYSSILEVVKNRVSNITLSIDIRLLPILSRSFPEVTFIDQNAPLDISLYDAQIPLGSLPVVLNMQPDMAGRRIPYLLDNDALTSTLMNNPCPQKLLKCGVAWRSANQKLAKNKSILLSELNDIFQIDGYEFINLQYGDTQEEIRDLEKEYGAKLTTLDDIDLFSNIDGLLSIIKKCDLIVTTSNVTAHLAGALGKTTFLLVPYSAGRIWYWHDEVVSSWYPSISLYSQDQNFEWTSPIKEIASRLKNEIIK